MSRAATRRVLLVVALLLGCFVYWHLMLRWFFLQRDDFWLVTISDEPSGRFGAGDFFWHWWHDWAQRNGRSSDAVVRLMLRPGTAAMAWIAPAILTACSAALWRWLPRGEGRAVEAARARDSVVPRLLLLTVVPVLGLTIPEVAGNTVFWAAGIGNYVIPTGLAVLAASWLVRPPTTPWMTGVAVLTVVAAGVLHEMAAVTVFVITHVWWLLHRRRVPGRGVVLIAASYGGLLLGFSGPGRWRRMDALVGEETGLLRWASSAARYTSEILLQAGPVWLALALAVSLAAVVARRAGTVTGGPGLWVALSGLWVSGGAAWWLARSWRAGDLRCSQVVPFGEEHATTAVLMLAAAAVAVVAAAGVLVLLRPVVGDHPLLLGAGALATMPIPMATGLCASRVWYPTLVWVLSLVAVLVIALGARRGLGRGALVVATVLGLVACGLLLLRAEPALRANHASFQEVLDQIPATRATGTGTIVFPEEVPHPAYGKEPVFRLPSIACGFRIYYAVPDQVVLDNGTAPAAGLPEYCPRPDAVRRP